MKFTTILGKWAVKNNFYYGTKQKALAAEKEVSHTCLDGGVLCVPDEKLLEFEKQYVKTLSAKKNNLPLQVCEFLNLKHDVHRFFMDIDFKYDPKAYEDHYKKIKECILTFPKMISKIFECDYRMIVCSRPPDVYKGKGVQNDNDEPKLLKTGFHIIFPDLYITNEVAKKTALYIQKELNGTHKEYKWKDIIDDKVYNGSLRMIGSCKGKSNLVYMPEIVIEDNGDNITEKYLQRGLKHFVSDCSIRAMCRMEPHQPYGLGDIEIPDSQLAIRYMVGRQHQVKGITPQKLQTYIAAIEEFIAKKIPSPMNEKWLVGDLSPTLFITAKNYYYRRNSKYCTNKGSEHDGENIYLEISADGLRQKCFCKCPVKRQYGYCKDYASTRYPLNAELFKLLFPKAEQKNNQKESYLRKENLFNNNTKLKDNRESYLKNSMLTLQHLETLIKK